MAAKRKRKVVGSIPEVARAVGVSTRTISDWLARGCPGQRGAYDLVAITHWRAEHVAARPGDQADVDEQDGEQQSQSQQRLKLQIASLFEDVRAKKLRNDLKERRLRDAVEVEQAISELVRRIKERLLAFPDEFEMQFPAETRAQNKADLEHAIRLLLSEMAQWKLSTQGENDGRSRDDAGDGADGQ